MFTIEKRGRTWLTAVLMTCLCAAACSAKAIPENEAWTESIQGWRFRHEGDPVLKARPGENIVLDADHRTAGKTSVHFIFPADRIPLIRPDVADLPRQIYLTLNLPDPPVDVSSAKVFEFDIRTEPEGAVVRIRPIFYTRGWKNQAYLKCPAATETAWRRYSVELGDLLVSKGPKPFPWRELHSVSIDILIPLDATRKAKTVEVWIDNLQFAQEPRKTDLPKARTPKAAPKRPTANPDLPVIQTEDLGEMVFGRTFVNSKMAPSTAGDGWSMYCLYKDHIGIRAAFEVFEVNCQTKKVEVWKGVEADVWRMFAPPDGNLYFLFGYAEKKGAEKKNAIGRLNVKLKKMEGFLSEAAYEWPYDMAWGPDGMIYTCTYRGGRALQLNPKTGKFTDYGKQADGLCRTIAADAGYVYTTHGSGPSRIVAHDRQSGRKTVVATFDDMVYLYPAHDAPNRACTLRRNPKTQKFGIDKSYFIEDAKLSPVPEGAPAYKWQNITALPGGGPTRPDYIRKSPMCLPDGKATAWFKPAGKEWQSVRFDVGAIPSTLFRIGTFGDGKVVASSNDPYTIFQWDPPAGKREILGLSPRKTHMYSFAGLDGKRYMCGYAGSPLFEWDSKKPWMWVPPNPETPLNWRDPKFNPRLCAYGGMRRAYKLVIAADKRVYVACGAYLERQPGGCLRIYDPATDTKAEIRKGFEVHCPYELCTAAQGRYVLTFAGPRMWNYKTLIRGLEKPPPEGFKLTQPNDAANGPLPRFVPWDPECYVYTYDTQTKEMLGRLCPVPGLREIGRAGELVEWKPGLVVGRVISPNRTNGGFVYPGKMETTFFLIDVEKQTCEITLTVPGRPSPYGLLRLPDGRLASNQWGVIHVIDPNTWTAELVGKFDHAPQDWALVGKDLYYITGTRLRRIRNFCAG